MPKKAVILLKAPTADDSAQDLYWQALTARGYSAHYIPVLEHGFTNDESLDRTLREDAAGHYSGVIVTSGRAVEAWGYSAQRITRTAVPVSLGWDKIPFYAVGPTTTENLRNMSRKYDVLGCLCPSIVLGGDQTGSGERLAHYIISKIGEHSSTTPPTLPLLYLTGDKTADTIPRLLDSAGLSVQPCQVYETSASTTFEADFTALLDKVKVLDEPIAWIAFFSPSGARTSLPAIRKRFSLLPSGGASGARLGTETVRLAAIGPTTQSFLVGKCDAAVSAMPEIPEPEALADAILRSDEGRGGAE